jgi:hypothetical protein
MEVVVFLLSDTAVAIASLDATNLWDLARYKTLF